MNLNSTSNIYVVLCSVKRRMQNNVVRCGVRTHALLREPELKSGALDHSANLTSLPPQHKHTGG